MAGENAKGRQCEKLGVEIQGTPRALPKYRIIELLKYRNIILLVLYIIVEWLYSFVKHFNSVAVWKPLCFFLNYPGKRVWCGFLNIQPLENE